MFLTTRFFTILCSIAALFALGLLSEGIYYLSLAVLIVFVATVIIDAAALLWVRLDGRRTIASKLDLGEENTVKIRFSVTRGTIKNAYIIDETPSQLITYATTSPLNHPQKVENGTFSMSYSVMPSMRGAYTLGRCMAYVSLLGLWERRIVIENEGVNVDVYPAFSRLREKDREVRSMQSMATGTHKRQLPANQTEFRDIREYVVGDDIRTINWKATARTGVTMVNEYEDERSQHIICAVDCGRAMHRTFNSLTLQDHAINTSLLVSYSALEVESDCVGICSYGPKGINFLPPRAGKVQFNSIMRQLYALETEYGESDLEELCLLIDRSVKRRSLIVLFTELPTMTSLERELPFLKRISARNCLLVVNCLDHELESVSERNFSNSTANSAQAHSNTTQKQSNTSQVQCVERSIANDMVLQKHLIADTLQQNGIYCVSTYPDHLSFSVLKKYIELKAKRAW